MELLDLDHGILTIMLHPNEALRLARMFHRAADVMLTAISQADERDAVYNAGSFLQLCAFAAHLENARTPEFAAWAKEQGAATFDQLRMLDDAEQQEATDQEPEQPAGLLSAMVALLTHASPEEIAQLQTNLAIAERIIQDQAPAAEEPGAAPELEY